MVGFTHDIGSKNAFVEIKFVTPLADPAPFEVKLPDPIDQAVDVRIDGPLNPYPITWELTSDYIPG